MKAYRQKTLLGLVMGDRSLLVAEVSGGELPEVKQVGEYAFPGDAGADPVAAGKGLAEFLKAKGISTRSAVVGLAAKRIVVKSKEVPPADRATLNSLLRIQAEGEFAAELKDLVYDYQGAATGSGGTGGSVLLVATPRATVEGAVALCRAAGLKPVGVTAAAIALGEVTGREISKDGLVLSVGPSGAELTSQHLDHTTSLRSLRGIGGGVGATGTAVAVEQDKAFIGELRRAVVPLTRDNRSRELVVWNGAASAGDHMGLGQSLGLMVRSPEISALGVRTATGQSPEGKYAAAVAVALSGMRDDAAAVDFLHTKLAPPKERAVPRWAVGTVVAAILLGGLGYWGYTDLKKQQDEVGKLQKQLLDMQTPLKTAESFVNNVGFAQGWHAGEPMYLGCLRAVTAAFPDDGQTYCVNLSVKEIPKPPSGNKKPVDTHGLQGTLTGKTSDQRRAAAVLDALKRSPYFEDVKSGGSGDVGRGQQVSFLITFTYRPMKKTAVVQPVSGGAVRPVGAGSQPGAE